MSVLKKTIFCGIGLANLAKERTEKVVNDLAARGGDMKDNNFRIVNVLVKKAEKREKELTHKTTDMIRRVIIDLGIPTKNDIDQLAKTLTIIDEKLAAMEKKE
jgi:polyhydroxyalkanoate synthesis regulator phasin